MADDSQDASQLLACRALISVCRLHEINLGQLSHQAGQLLDMHRQSVVVSLTKMCVKNGFKMCHAHAAKVHVGGGEQGGKQRSTHGGRVMV